MMTRKPFWHVLSEIDPIARTAVCSVCGHVGLKSKGYRGGIRAWRCKISSKQLDPMRRVNSRKRAYIRHKKPACQKCGKAGTQDSPLHIHHINGDHADNRVENLLTLCVVCHWNRHGMAVKCVPEPEYVI